MASPAGPPLAPAPLPAQAVAPGPVLDAGSIPPSDTNGADEVVIPAEQQAESVELPEQIHGGAAAAPADGAGPQQQHPANEHVVAAPAAAVPAAVAAAAGFQFQPTSSSFAIPFADGVKQAEAQRAMDEAAKAQADAEAKRALELDSIVSPVGCPIAAQPVTTLALICRCLDARDLLAVYKTGHLLNSAASHPLTFQHATGWTVHPWADHDSGVRVLGPSARCSSYAKASAAFRSKLFCCFKFLTLASRDPPSAHERDQLPALLNFLAPESAQPQQQAPPVLRVLSLEYRLPTHFGFPRFIATAPALRYLQVLCVTLPMLTPATHGLFPPDLSLPPNLRLIQITLQHSSVYQLSSSAVLVESNGLAELIAPLKDLRQLIFRDPLLASVVPGRYNSPYRTTLADIHALASIEAAAPQLDELLWLISLQHDDLVRDMRAERRGDLSHPFPKLRKVMQLKVTRVGLLDEALDDPNPLCMFPELRDLRVFHKPEVAAAIAPSTQLLFDQLGSVPLTHLLSLTITNYLVSDATEADFTPLFRNLPTLRHFTSPRILLRDFKTFALLPSLLSTRDVLWTKDLNPTGAEMALAFPSLTSLHCWSAVYSTAISVAPVLVHVPHLRAVMWNKEAPIHPHTLAQRLSKIEANRARLLSKRAEAAAAATASLRSKCEDDESDADAEADEAARASGGGSQKRERDDADPVAEQTRSATGATAVDPPLPAAPPAGPFVLPELDALHVTPPSAAAPDPAAAAASASALSTGASFPIFSAGGMFACPPKKHAAASKHSASGKHRVSGGAAAAAGVKSGSSPSFGAGASAAATAAPVACPFAFGDASASAPAFAFAAAVTAPGAAASAPAAAAWSPSLASFGACSFGSPAPATAPFDSPFVFHAQPAASASASQSADPATATPLFAAPAAAASFNGDARATAESNDK